MNIRWELYKQAHGIGDEDVEGWNYIAWITNKADDYMKTHEIKGYFSAKQNAEFDKWLSREVEDG